MALNEAVDWSADLGGGTRVALVQAGTFRSDAGALFGPVPRLLWDRLVVDEIDHEHRLLQALNCLMVETQSGRVLVETGIGERVDEKTRTMAVELDVRNPGLQLGAGMYPEVQWPVRRPQPSLLVPPTTVVTTTERTFVIRVKDGAAEWVDVNRGARVGDLIEVFGALKDGDLIVRRGTDEIRQGAKVAVQPPKASS